jgi:hypothetical protein
MVQKSSRETQEPRVTLDEKNRMTTAHRIKNRTSKQYYGEYSGEYFIPSEENTPVSPPHPAYSRWGLPLQE